MPKDRKAPFARKIFPTGEQKGRETMPGPRQPTELIKARGKKHLSQQEEDLRRAAALAYEAARLVKENF